MVSSTRSGRLSKEKETNSRIQSAGSKAEVAKGSPSKSRSAHNKATDSKGSFVSGSTSTNSPSLRGSSSDTTKTSSSSSFSTRRSQRFEKQDLQEPSVSLNKKTSEQTPRKRPASPLRRSGRIEKRQCSDSPGSKISEKDDKKENESTNKKGASADMMEKVKNGKPNTKENDNVSKKKKRLDARSYRALFKPLVKKQMDTDVGQNHGDDTLEEGNRNREKSEKITAEGNADNSKENDSVNIFVKRDICNEQENILLRKSDDKNGQGHEEFKPEYAEHSQRGLHLSEQINLHVAKDSKCEAKQMALRCRSSSWEFFSEDAVRKEVDGDANLLEKCCLAKDSSKTPEMTDYKSEEGSVAFDGQDSCGVVESVKKANITPDIDSSVVSDKNDAFVRKTLLSDANCVSLSTQSKFDESCPEYCEQRSNANGLTASDSVDSGNMKHCISNVRTSKEDNTKVKLVQMMRGKSSTQRMKATLTDSPDLVCVPSCRKEDRRGTVSLNDNNDVVGKVGTTTEIERVPLSIETEEGQHICVICKHPGILLHCTGKDCKRSYHLSCLDPPMMDVPPGTWHCLCCVRKKLQSGIYSVAAGIESVWDTRVVEVSDNSGVQKEKQFLVKYLELAHVHNRWISEKELLSEAPNLLTKFNKHCQKEKVMLWKEEWTKPQRLLSKRLIMPPKLADEYFCGRGSSTDLPHCYYEWFVKWTGLGYEHATWEFENSAFLTSSEAMTLIREYENRHEEAKMMSDSTRADKVMQIRKYPLSKFLKMPDGFSVGLDRDYINSVNKLREYWHRSENAVLVNDQDRILKVGLFISALLSDVCQPFLIIVTPDSLRIWESEFMRLMPTINVIVYDGNKQTRKMIRNLEFYEESGCIMFRVLLSHYDAIIEDLDAVDCIRWEAMIVDDCQLSKLSKHLKQFQVISSDCRIVLYNSQLKDTFVEYINLLSFLDYRGDQNLLSQSTAGTSKQASDLSVLKQRFAKYCINELKPEISKFLEFWVPVQLSNVQLEEYCAILVSGSTTLRSSSKVDQVGALRDILVSTRKCCDHPYLVDSSLQGLLTKGLPPVEYLDIGVHASGKLRILDKILLEMKSRGLRAVVLFQFNGGEGKISIGDILDDFLRQRFGADSYERVDSGLTMAKKQAALQMYNSKDSGRFVFLIEHRACLPSIKLSSVDAVIVFSSDWNPLNDVKALQKISINSQFEQIKVFRLYSLCTVEEMVLLLAKQDVILESNIPNISRNISNSLLRWGASQLFDKLDEFHKCDSPSSICLKASFERPFLSDIVLEIVSQLSCSSEAINSSCSIISRVQQSGMAYPRTISLFGEKDTQMSDEEPHIFWSKLLDGRYPHWRYITGLSQRVRRKVQQFDEPPQQLRDLNDEVKKKRKRVSSISEDPTSLQASGQDKQKEVSAADEKDLNGTTSKHGVAHVLKVNEVSKVNTERGGKLRDLQKNLHLTLKPELVELCHTLHLSDDVKDVAEMFLEYIMNNLHVNQEQKTLLQALKISLCWRAASFLKHKIDHKESLSIAKKHLNFECKEEEAEPVYSKLRMLKKKFSRPADVGINTAANHSTTSSDQEVDKFNIREIDRQSVQHLGLADQTDIQEDGIPLKDVLIKQISQSEKNGSPCTKGVHFQRLEQVDLRSSLRCELKSDAVISCTNYCGESSALSHQVPNMEYGNSLHCEARTDPGIATYQVELEFSDISGGEGAEKVPCSSPSNGENSRQADTEPNIRHTSVISDIVQCAQTLSSSQPTVIAGDQLMSTVPFIEQQRFQSADAIASEACCSTDPSSSPPVKVPVIPVDVRQAPGMSTLSNEIYDEQVTHSSVPVVIPTLQSAGYISSGELETTQSDRISCSHSSQLVEVSTAQTPEHLLTIEHNRCTMLEANVNEQQLNPSQAPQENVTFTYHDVATSERNVMASLPPTEVFSPVDCTSTSIAVVDVQRQHFSHSAAVPAVQSAAVHAQLLVDSVSLQVQSPGISPPVQDVAVVQFAPSGSLPSAEASVTPENEQPTLNEMQSLTNDTEISLQNQDDTMLAESGPSEQLAMQTVMSQLGVRSNPYSGRTSHDSRNDSVQQELGSNLPQPFEIHARLPAQGLHPDPLQNELYRINKEKELLSQMCDDMKLRLKAECDNELEKVRIKYDMLIHNAEAAFLDKQKILAVIYNKVTMNRILAEEFRSKFSDNKAATVKAASPQGTGSSFRQQLQQLSQSRFAQRPASAPLMIPSVAPVTSMAPLTTTAPVPVPIPSMASSTTTAPVRVPVPSFHPLTTLVRASPSSSDTQRAVAIPAPSAASMQPLQVVTHPSALFSTNPSRPHISPILPSLASLQAGSTQRSPAPHLHSFRPPVSVRPATLQSNGNPNQQQALANHGFSTSVCLQPVTSSLPLASSNTARGITKVGSFNSSMLPHNASIAAAAELPRGVESRIEPIILNLPRTPESGSRADELTYDVASMRATGCPPPLGSSGQGAVSCSQLVSSGISDQTGTLCVLSDEED